MGLLDDQLGLLFIDIEHLVCSAVRSFQLLLQSLVLAFHVVFDLRSTRRNDQFLFQVLDFGIFAGEVVALGRTNEWVVV